MCQCDICLFDHLALLVEIAQQFGIAEEQLQLIHLQTHMAQVRICQPMLQ